MPNNVDEIIDTLEREVARLEGENSEYRIAMKELNSSEEEEITELKKQIAELKAALKPFGDITNDIRFNYPFDEVRLYVDNEYIGHLMIGNLSKAKELTDD